MFSNAYLKTWFFSYFPCDLYCSSFILLTYLYKWRYNYLCNQCLSPLMLWVILLRRGLLNTTLCDYCFIFHRHSPDNTQQINYPVNDVGSNSIGTVSSPGIRRITCPICMDDYKEVRWKLSHCEIVFPSLETFYFYKSILLMGHVVSEKIEMWKVYRRW
jgi:hypothetical protein